MEVAEAYTYKKYDMCCLRDLLMITRGRIEAYDGLKEFLTSMYEDEDKKDVPLDVLISFIEGGRNFCADAYDRYRKVMTE